MKKHLVGVILAFLFLFVPNYADAESACSYSEQAELNNIASNVKATYDVADIYMGKAVNMEEEGAPEVDWFVKGLKINILNITEDIYIKLINQNTKEEKTYRHTDTEEGLIAFETADVENVVNYTIEVYAAKYACAGELIRKIEFLTPQYNSYSELEVCSTYPDFYYCQEFLLGENISREAFFERIREYGQNKEIVETEEEKDNTWDKVKEFYNKNKWTINIVGIFVVIIGVSGIVILIKKRRSRVL